MRKKRILFIIVFALALYFIIQYMRLIPARQAAYDRLASLPSRATKLSYGQMTYIDSQDADGEVILSAHGLFGGYDQAYDNLEPFHQDYRIIAPSRFGYLGSEVFGQGSPLEQAQAYEELLDQLNIDQVFILGTSAGGTPAIRFALEYPERVKGLILYCSAAPAKEPPAEVPSSMGPPDFLNQDWIMWSLSPLFEPILGMSSDTIHWMLPLEERRVGADLDARITNPDMLLNFHDYPIEELQVPTLIVHAKDDKTAPFERVAASMDRYPDLTTLILEEGGHLMVGNEDKVEAAVHQFITTHSSEKAE